MGIAYNTSIVRDGLVLHLDAANVKSYPGSGTVWKDLSGNGNNGILVNGVGYSTDNKGSIVFDGTNNYAVVAQNVSLPYAATARTVDIWFYTNATSWAENVNNLFFYGAGTTGNAFGIDMSTYPNMEFYSWGGVGRDLFFTTSFSQIGWKNITIKYNGATLVEMFQNGIKTTSLTLAAPCNTTSSAVYIGSSINPVVRSWYFDGKISTTKIYGRALSDAEINQNFEALRGRYGI